jgi:hypothetical protein
MYYYDVLTSKSSCLKYIKCTEAANTNNGWLNCITNADSVEVGVECKDPYYSTEVVNKPFTYVCETYLCETGCMNCVLKDGA